MSAGRLVHKDTLVEVNIGDKITGYDGTEYILKGWRKPHKISSTGRVFITRIDDPEFESSLFPTVFDLKIVDFD